MDIACLAFTGAAAGLPDAYAKARGDAATLRPLYARRLRASAAGVRVAADRAAAEADGYRQTELADVRSPDPAAARREQAELARDVENCAALPFFELLDRVRRK